MYLCCYKHNENAKYTLYLEVYPGKDIFESEWGEPRKTQKVITRQDYERIKQLMNNIPFKEIYDGYGQAGLDGSQWTIGCMKDFAASFEYKFWSPVSDQPSVEAFGKAMLELAGMKVPDSEFY